MDDTFDTSEHCAECGGQLQAGWTCWEQLGLLIGCEFDDLELHNEHFLTVACYNLQHPAQFTDTALAVLRASFVGYLDDGLSITEIRRPPQPRRRAQLGCCATRPSGDQC